MNYTNINQIIKKNSLPIEEILIDKNLIQDVNIFVKRLGFKNKNLLIVSDDNTNYIAAEIIKNIKNNNIFELCLSNPYAHKTYLKEIKKHCSNIDLIIAVGSGTINDLSKLASFEQKIPYIIFATAPSMNGYASANASIVIDGYKKSVKCHQPKAIYMDLDVIKNSPNDLIKAGIGDSLCYWSCKFDWKLSNLLIQTDFNEEVFKLLKPYQEKLVNYKGSNFRDEFFIKTLCEVLIISGICMYLCEGSYPASQGEHLIAHFLEMKNPNIFDKYFHGQQIAVTTLTMMEIHEKFLKLDKLELKNKNISLDNLLILFDGDKKVAKQSLQDLTNKRISTEKLEEINKNFNKIKIELQKQTIQLKTILEIYNKFDLFKSYNDLNLSKNIYNDAVQNAYLIRDRLTALDFII